MKHYLTRIFEFMGRPENFGISVLLMVVYTVVVISFGMLLAWLIHLLVVKSIEKKMPVSFDDFGFPDTFSKIRRVK